MNATHGSAHMGKLIFRYVDEAGAMGDQFGQAHVHHGHCGCERDDDGLLGNPELLSLGSKWKRIWTPLP